MELQEKLVAAKIPQHVIDLVMSDKRPIKNQEAIEKGDTIKLIGFGDNGEAEINKVPRKWVNIACEGDRCNISMTNLIGTKKLSKHFKDYVRNEKTVCLSNDIRQAVIDVEELFGKTITCVDKVEVELPFTRTNAKGEEEPATTTYCLWELV